jgi:hypothetical protein
LLSLEKPNDLQSSRQFPIYQPSIPLLSEINITLNHKHWEEITGISGGLTPTIKALGDARDEKHHSTM